MAPQFEFESWLREVDPSGTLNVYLPALEEHGDEPTFLAEYIVLDEAGKAALNTQFFGSFGVNNPAHQHAFVKGVSNSAFSPPPRQEQAARPDEKELERLLKGTIHGTAESVATELSAEKVSEPSVKTATKLDFAEWLRSVDPDGSLDGYLAALEENYDVEDVDKLWHDGRFFEDIMIVVPEHRELFAKYFAKQ